MYGSSNLNFVATCCVITINSIQQILFTKWLHVSNVTDKVFSGPCYLSYPFSFFTHLNQTELCVLQSADGGTPVSRGALIRNANEQILFKVKYSCQNWVEGGTLNRNLSDETSVECKVC